MSQDWDIRVDTTPFVLAFSKSFLGRYRSDSGLFELEFEDEVVLKCNYGEVEELAAFLEKVLVQMAAANAEIDKREKAGDPPL